MNQVNDGYNSLQYSLLLGRMDTKYGLQVAAVLLWLDKTAHHSQPIVGNLLSSFSDSALQ